MKRYLLGCSIALLPLLASSCKMNTVTGKGSQVTEARRATGFNAIDISVPIEVTITVQEGAQPSVMLMGYENIVKLIRTDMEGNTLQIHMQEGFSFHADPKVKAQITVPSLSALSLEGSPDAFVLGNITGNEFKLSISGSSDVSIDNINVTKFSSEVSGAGEITVKGGHVQSAEYDISGSGTIKAFPLQTDETEASIAGSGDGFVTAEKKLSASISGSGSIKYKGHPEVKQDISGSGTITAQN